MKTYSITVIIFHLNIRIVSQAGLHVSHGTAVILVRTAVILRVRVALEALHRLIFDGNQPVCAD